MALVAGIMAFIWYRVALLRWHPFAEHYGQVRETPVKTKYMQRVIVHGDGFAHNNYGGIVTVGVSRSGVHVKLLPPWSVFHQPLFIPYSDISVTERHWFLFNAIEIKTRKAGNMRMVIYPELWQWIEDYAQANKRNIDDDYYYSSTPRETFARG
ncbi:MAG: hypothetical protein K0U74_15545 [Alphaproteobacteria bacterium]|nr:hypothetical protein [Alphaproteobacteria bacterium]